MRPQTEMSMTGTTEDGHVQAPQNMIILWSMSIRTCLTLTTQPFITTLLHRQTGHSIEFCAAVPAFTLQLPLPSKQVLTTKRLFRTPKPVIPSLWATPRV